MFGVAECVCWVCSDKAEAPGAAAVDHDEYSHCGLP